ncbi:hypothetical protein BU23DRAFT_108203 [Bimuria novae-zelandiae CBS 107.79]|uniref:Uncharacterized protein n=1 Tax=Bimuria novae-zelandiae CBS 107.79 TaxID=1447943 RepID=A0A6A5VTJ2_9PLEO|nr:hypothetical protein BU23DRAFT_108203 [Bimuria novae-zelandiae CBS 107.79]
MCPATRRLVLCTPIFSTSCTSPCFSEQPDRPVRALLIDGDVLGEVFKSLTFERSMAETLASLEKLLDKVV